MRGLNACAIIIFMLSIITCFFRNWKNFVLVLVVLLILGGFAFFIFRFSSTLNQARVDNLLSQAEADFEIANFDEAFNIYQRLLRLNLEFPAKHNFYLGKLYLFDGDQEKASFYFKKAVEGDQRLFEAHYLLGVIYAYAEPEKAMQELTLVEENFEKAKKFKSEFEKIVKEENLVYQKALLGHLLIEENCAFLALFPLRDLVSAYPEYRDAHTLLGAAYLKLSRFNRAEVELKKALEIDPNHEETRKLLEKLSQKDIE